MKMFTPFAYPPGKGEDQAPRSDAAPEPAPASDDTLKALQEQLAAMQAQINKLASKD